METSELLKRVRKIEIKTRGLSKNIFAGEYHSAFKGRGMTFSEVREYQYGDDIRNIDWNVTARHAIRRQVILLLERLDRRNRRIAIIAVNGRIVEAELFQLRLQILDRAAGCAFAERVVILVAVRVLVRAVELFERFAARHAVRRQVILLLERANRRVCARTKRAVHRSEERRVGIECLRLCRSRWSPYH